MTAAQTNNSIPAFPRLSVTDPKGQFNFSNETTLLAQNISLAANQSALSLNFTNTYTIDPEKGGYTALRFSFSEVSGQNNPLATFVAGVSTQGNGALDAASLYATSETSIYNVSKNSISARVFGEGATVSSIPEPGPAHLLVAGLATIGLLRRKKPAPNLTA